MTSNFETEDRSPSQDEAVSTTAGASQALGSDYPLGMGHDFGTGTKPAVALDDQGHCIEAHCESGKFYYRVGVVDFSQQTIEWGARTLYDSGSYMALASRGNHCIEVHNGSNNLYYRVGTVDYESKTIDWGPSTKYATGSYVSVALGTAGQCVETHNQDGKLYYTVGSVDYENQSITWGSPTQYDTGTNVSVAMDVLGRCIDIHRGSGNKLYCRVGQVDFDAKTIQWGASTQYDTGSNLDVSMSDAGFCFEAHRGSDDSNSLYFNIGRLVRIKEKTIVWGHGGHGTWFDTGSDVAAAIDNHYRCVVIRSKADGSNTLSYFVDSLTLDGSDCEMGAGFYDLDVSSAFEHSYAKAQADGSTGSVGFQCYGGTSGPKNEFPADLKKPHRIKAIGLGAVMRARLDLARGVAQYELDYDIRSNYDRNTGGWLDLGDCSGIIYALMGVCHQMCNRVLCACTGFDWMDQPINWPPSYSASRLVWWARGPAWSLPLFTDFSKALMDEINSPSTAEARQQWQRQHEEKMLSLLREHLDPPTALTTRRQEMMGRLDELAAERPEGLSDAVRDAVLELDQAFQAEKSSADIELLRGNSTTEAYADRVNHALRQYYAAAQKTLPQDVYVAILGDVSDPASVTVIVPAEMPSADQYGAIGKRLGL